MQNDDRNYLKNETLIRSFKNAFNGIRLAMFCEKNLRCHVLAAVIAVVAGFILKIDSTRWVLLLLVIGIVFICEFVNTSLEVLTDMVTKEYSDEAKRVKDIAAAAVLVAAILSVVVGIYIFFG